MLNPEEYNSEDLVLAPTNGLPATGVPVAGIRIYAELPSRKQTERDLEIFINSCLNADKIYGCVIKAWWGEGKTDAYENFIKPMLKNKNIISFEIIATTIARILEKRKQENMSDSVIWIALLAAIFEAVWEEQKLEERRKLEVEFFRRNEEEIKSDHEYVKRVINQLMKKSSKVFFFIDELEQLERLPNREDILLGIRGLFDQTTYTGSMHLIMACTPEAFNRLISSSPTQIGGLLDRLRVIELPHPSKEEAVKFVYGLVDYLYKGKLPSHHPFINTGPAYAVMYAGHCSPRSMIKVLQHIIEYAKTQAKNTGKDGYLKRINGWEIINALKNFNLPMFGTQALALDGDVLDKVEHILSIKNDKPKTTLLIKLIRLLIGEPIPHSLKELSDRLNVSDSKIKDLINIANNKAEEAKLIKGQLILQLTESSKSLEDISEDLRKYSIQFVFTNNSRTFKTRTFLPSKESSLRSISFEIDLSYQSIFKKILSLSTGEDYYLISLEFIEHVYPNPEFLELDFIKDKNLRLELWKNAYEFINDENALALCEESFLDGLKRLGYLIGGNEGSI